MPARAFRLMRLAMDACLIALIKIHVTRRDIAGGVADADVQVFSLLDVLLCAQMVESSSLGKMGFFFKSHVYLKTFP